MSEVPHGPCPFVSCGSSDAFSYNTGGFGKCHACDRKYPSSERMFEWASERYPTAQRSEHSSFSRKDDNLTVVSYTPKRIESVSAGEYKSIRGISKRVMEDYNVLTYEDRQEYIYPSGGIKVRTLAEKGFYAKNGFKGDELFGMNLYTAASAKRLTITEGEIDALSVSQMLRSSYINPVVSLPSASPSKKLWDKCYDWVNSFEQIILSIDNDDAGNEVAAKIAKLFPNKVYRVDHSKFKDANEFLQNNAENEFKAAWWGAKKYVPENILNTSDQFLKLYQDTPNHLYVPTGITELDDKILGLMQGHFTVFKAPTGIGKTELMRYLEYTLLKKGIPIAAWHLEETKLRSLLGLVSYELQDNVTRRDLIEEKGREQDVVKAITDLTKDELFYQFYLQDGEGSDELCDQIRYFSQACGVRYVFFEPIQDVISGSSDESKEQMLADLSVRLSKLAAELNVGIVSIGHTNDNGDFKYCRMIGQRASVIVNLQRDKESTDMQERNTTHLHVEKNRPTGEVGTAGKMRFNTDTFTLRELF